MVLSSIPSSTPKVSLMVGSSNLLPITAPSTARATASTAGRYFPALDLPLGLTPILSDLLGQAATHSPQSMQSTAVSLWPSAGTSM